MAGLVGLTGGGVPKPPAPMKQGKLGFSGPVRPNFGPRLGAPKPPKAAGVPASGGAPVAPAAAPGAGTTGGMPASPLDSTFFNNLAANQFKVGNQINSLTASSQNANTALQDALAKLAYQQPRDSLRLEQGANSRGGLFSSVYDQNQGNLLHQYQTRESEATRANAQRQAAIQAQITALQQGEPIFAGQQYDAAVGRATRAAASNPATGQPPIDTTPPAPPVASSRPPAPSRARPPAPRRVLAQRSSSRGGRR